ncbi:MULTISPECIES: efflux RND transporter periplasmic adaptor subunit [Helicobacter]|uniref:Efflux RND transporter periplasmic adaptor subunit n=1 Tax=Helicobacter ganmani TaxID=60246 RepID=A0A3D8IF89_9HELI|nr:MULTISPECIES: efflux RND transporter periplasmic adaptor subunit [Helicobacter]RDU63839.1 efflux RND transporter periplasmic adaptor subunit [Helicobacter ganmani]
MKNYLKILSQLFLGVLCGVVLLTGCSKENKGGEQQQNMALPVNTHNVKRQDVPINFEYPAKLTSLQSVGIYARVEGVLLEQYFVEGALVKKGDKLFKIEPDKYQAAVNMARAAFKAAQRDWIRAQKLFKNKALSPKEYDSAQSTYENTRANLDAAMIDLGYTDVMATASGKISMKRYDIGDLVGKVGADNLLTTITQLDPIHAEFSIPSNDYYFLRTLDYENVKVIYLLSDGTPFDNLGKLDFIDSVLEPSTATIKARAIVENPEHLLVPGEFSRIRLDGIIAKDCIAIPQVALMQDAKGSFVFKVVEGKAQPTPVVLGYNIGNDVIIKSGLNDGDIIVTSQLIKLRPGAPVTPLNQAQTNQAPNNQAKP